MIYTVKCPLPCGDALIAVSDNGLCGLYFIDAAHSVEQLKQRIAKNLGVSTNDIQDNADMTLAYIEGITQFWQNGIWPSHLKLDLHGTEFQKNIWAHLLNIKSGESCTYSELAAKSGNPKAIRAAASAVARNPVSLIVPCHRVLPKSGGVGNYLWGSAMKSEILIHEKAIAA